MKPQLTELREGTILGLICFGIGFYCVITIQQTHDEDLDLLKVRNHCIFRR